MKTFTLLYGLLHQKKKIMLPKVTENQVSPSVNCRNKEVYLRFREYINARVKHYYSKMWIPEIFAPDRGKGLTETLISEKK
jgi:hypothetical protein